MSKEDFVEMINEFAKEISEEYKNVKIDIDIVEFEELESEIQREYERENESVNNKKWSISLYELYGLENEMLDNLSSDSAKNKGFINVPDVKIKIKEQTSEKTVAELEISVNEKRIAVCEMEASNRVDEVGFIEQIMCFIEEVTVVAIKIIPADTIIRF
ncbi:MAG: hypothetical protein ACK5LZ_06150 [Anaerorhabdus sp.]